MCWLRVGISGGLWGEIDEMKQGEHELGYINSVFDRISRNLSNEVTVYHIGGNAMCWYGLKETTKDADLVLTNKSEINSFRFAVLDSGFIEVEIVSVPGYEHINQYAIFDEVRGIPLGQEFTPGLRVELFLDQICGGFGFSGGMKSRCMRGDDRGLLREYFCSMEDIFLFKSITERERDLEDMYRIHRSKPDFEVIRAELRYQLDSMDVKTRRYLLESVKRSLDSLREGYGISLELL